MVGCPVIPVGRAGWDRWLGSGLASVTAAGRVIVCAVALIRLEGAGVKSGESSLVDDCLVGAFGALHIRGG